MTEGVLVPISMIHGCVANRDSHLESTRNYVDEGAFCRFLSALPSRYSHLSSGTTGASLTIDDATVGAYRACLLARELGHEVTIFINPAQVIRQRAYWFSTLDALLDGRQVDEVDFRGLRHALEDSAGLRRFRLALKTEFRCLREEQTDGIMHQVRELLAARSAELPLHARTLTIEEIHQLASMGVTIGSHGWDHKDISCMSPDELIHDLDSTRLWITELLGREPQEYAVPYGMAFVPAQLHDPARATMFRADPGSPLCGPVYQHLNRKDITKLINGT